MNICQSRRFSGSPACSLAVSCRHASGHRVGGVFRRRPRPSDVDQLAHLDVQPGQFAHRVGLERRLVAEVLVAVEQDAELRAPVAEVVVGDDRVAQEAQQPRQGVADDRAAQMADVHRLGDVGRAVIDDEGPRRRRRRDAEPLVARPSPGPAGPASRAQAQVDEARARRSPAARAGRPSGSRSTISWATSRGFLPSTLASDMAQLAW